MQTWLIPTKSVHWLYLVFFVVVFFLNCTVKSVNPVFVYHLVSLLVCRLLLITQDTFNRLIFDKANLSDTKKAFMFAIFFVPVPKI